MSERCFNHPEKEALNVCHSCNQHYCEECLITGEEFYYCNKEKCQTMLNEEKLNTDNDKSEIINTLHQRNKIFYKRVFIILAIAWVIISFFLYASLRPMALYYYPLFSLIVCLKWLIIIWISRLIWCKIKYRKANS
ncbi:hypothetical protein BMS3Abin10_01558 [bacterium BMS3Abin10]|nr:hypothetical protein BMS3Abin10_01558 [bacterium BMS3Abin10]